MLRALVLCLSLALVQILYAAPPAVSQVPLTKLPLNTIRLPEGFSISLYSTASVPGARQLAVSRGKSSAYPDAIIVYAGSTYANGTVCFLPLHDRFTLHNRYTLTVCRLVLACQTLDLLLHGVAAMHCQVCYVHHVLAAGSLPAAAGMLIKETCLAQQAPSC